jgi:hypothetical protein
VGLQGPRGKGKRRVRSGLIPFFVLLVSLVLSSNALSSGWMPAASAVTASPVPVALGVAANFSALGSSVGNTGTSVFEHDIGVYPGAISGFPPGITSGTIHLDDQAAQNGLAAASAAYSDAKSRTVTGGVLPGDLIGVTLTSGVYYSAAAIANSGTLTLDGQGNPNAVFIFQIQAALNMAAVTNVNLINGATATNVFWQVDGAVTI